MRNSSLLPGNEALFTCPPDSLSIRPLLRKLPAFHGAAIRIEFRPELIVSAGRLQRAGGGGAPVHGATSIAKRRILLEDALQRRPMELRRILTHEIFHFVWARLANSQRWAFEELLDGEFEQRARGELGWSAESAKARLLPADRRSRSWKWRQYVCESFCDSAAWFFAVGNRPHDELTLKPRFRALRAAWFRNLFRAERQVYVQ